MKLSSQNLVASGNLKFQRTIKYSFVLKATQNTLEGKDSNLTEPLFNRLLFMHLSGRQL